MATRSQMADNSWATTGAFLAVTGLAGGLFVLFAVGGACTFVTSLLLIVLILLLITGGVLFLFGMLSQKLKRNRFERRNLH